MTKSEMSQFKTVATSEHKLFDLHLKETFGYRDLIMLFVKRDFVSKYKQTILGPAWAVIQPLLTTIVFTVIFGNLANLTTADAPGEANIPGFLFYMAGTICWTYFSGVLSGTSTTFLSNAAIMGKVYFPRLVSPIATTISNLIQFAIQFVMFLGFWAFYLIRGGTDIRPSWYLCLLPLIVLQMMLLGMGCGIVLSSLTTKYRDLNFLVSFGLQLWQYATPIAYGLALIPDKLQTLYMMNPVTSIVLTFRYAFFGVGYFSLFYYLLSWAVTLVILFIGLILFNRIERTFMDTI